MKNPKNQLSFSERRISRNFQRGNTHEQRVVASITADVQSVFKHEKLSQDGIDYILNHEKLVDCEIYILKLLDKRAWKSEMALHPDVSKISKDIMDACSNEDLKLLKKRIIDSYPDEEDFEGVSEEEAEDEIDERE